MLSILLLTLLVIHCQSFDFQYSYYDQYCGQYYSPNTTEYFFCQYYHVYKKFEAQKFPTLRECSSCRSFFKLLEWNGHTGRAAENLVDYTSKNFCRKLRGTKKTHCTEMMIKYSPNMKTYLSKTMRNGTFCEAFLKCNRSEKVENYQYFYKSFYKSFEPESFDFYPAQLFRYIFEYQYGQYEYPMYSVFKDFFYHNESDSQSDYYFEKFFHAERRRHHMIPYYEFKMFFHNSSESNETFPWAFFEYFMKSQDYENGFNFFYFFNYYLKIKAGDEVCKVCNSIPKKSFEEWSATTDLKNWKQKSYSAFCLREINKQACHEIVDNVLDFWYSSWKEKMTQESICDDFFECKRPSNPSPADVKTMYPFVSHEMYKKEEKSCEICRIFSGLMHNVTEESSYRLLLVNKFRETQCLGEFTSKDECEKYIAENLESVMKSISEEIKNNRLCERICPKNLEMYYYDYFYSFFEKRTPQNNKKLCEITSSIMVVLAYSEPFKTEIETELLKTVCNSNLIPTNECSTFLEKRLPKILIEMLREVNEGKLCNSSSKPVMFEKSFDYVNMDKCEVCQTVIQKLQIMRFQQGGKIHHFKDLWQRTCVSMPIMGYQCMQLFLRFEREIKEMVKVNMSTKEICITISQCQNFLNTNNFFKYYFQ